ncbi:MAG: hypothetical protein ABIJ57_12075 [Pseudomonadota bacterium]
MNYLEKLKKVSKKREDGGFIHGGHIHYIQAKLSDEQEGLPFLKALIYSVLVRVPEVFPYELPELVEREGFTPMEKMNSAYKEIAEDIIMPFDGWDICRVILAAREYEKVGP